MLEAAVGLVLGYLGQKGRRAASRADEQVDRAVDAGVEGLGALIGRRRGGGSGTPSADTAETAVMPADSPGTQRRWALVEPSVSPVHHEPAATRRPLKYKYRHDRVELFLDAPPREDWLAVRTPTDAPGYKWMPAADLRVLLPPPLPDPPQ